MLKINPRTTILIIITALIAIVIILAGQCYIFYKDIQTQKDLNRIYQYNEKILNFTKLFITKVIRAKEDVSFEDRLQLENAVREINNKAIFDQWQKFTEAKSEAQAQEDVKILLDLLVNKITR
ncbi:hypothetical protein KKE19_04495 [Patescibacteria group bacterium]|nr:hypothetical protein [Patescibacteria group bacterium]MBU4367610.1 hypothetical protein [Patescibacteria group bacterium]MBU4462079.1 hypothetical protein [Patescibacteria group bacterium]MCG2700465.1 hypothetical protein [Candidatus Parcubacteria bacterium]